MLICYNLTTNACFQEVTQTLYTLGVETDKGNESLEGGMAELRQRMKGDRIMIRELRQEVKQLNSTIEQLRANISMLTTVGIKNKEARVEAEQRYVKLDKKSSEVIANLKQELKSARETMKNQQTTIHQLLASEKAAKQKYEEVIEELRAKLHVTTKQMELALKQRDKQKAELADVNDKTRKLLKVVDLDNKADNMALSIEHARNLTYVKRRKGGAAVNGLVKDPPQPPITGASHEDTSLKIGMSLPTKGTATQGIQTNAHGSSFVSLSNDSGIHSNETPRLPMEKCEKCNRMYIEQSNFEGACIFHPEGSTLVHEGTDLNVWSCCMSQDTIKGCLKARHVPVVNTHEM